MRQGIRVPDKHVRSISTNQRTAKYTSVTMTTPPQHQEWHCHGNSINCPLGQQCRRWMLRKWQAGSGGLGSETARAKTLTSAEMVCLQQASLCATIQTEDIPTCQFIQCRVAERHFKTPFMPLKGGLMSNLVTLYSSAAQSSGNHSVVGTSTLSQSRERPPAEINMSVWET